jgi:predicted dehydrogenase
MSNRRTFLTELAAGAAAWSSPALASSRVIGANDRIGFALIGGGARGKEIFRAALKCKNVQPVAVADVYTRRLDEVKAIAPGIHTYQDYRKLLEDKAVDAVLIATPQHQHVLSFVASIEAGKDVYQEKTLAFNPGHARRMRAALKASDRVVQVGMQMNSGEGLAKAKEVIASGKLGELTAIQAHHYRNAPYGGWVRQVPPDCDTQHIDWTLFQAETKPYPFDPQRYMNWRFYWDYSGGNVFENMVHQVGFWTAALDLDVPTSVNMTGGNFRSPKMQVPDTMNVCMSHAGKLMFNWISMFGNDYFGETDDYAFGSKGTLIHRQTDQVEFAPQPGHAAHTAGAPSTADGEYLDFTGRHMTNFFDCVRSRKATNCPFETGFRAAIACQMAIASYRRQAPVHWDPATEEIV